MPLKKGDAAPDFTLYDDDKNAVSLSDFRDKKNVLLLFFPGAFTSVCTSELNAVNNDIGETWGDDVQILGVSTDSPFVQAEFKKVNNLQFPLLSDHDAAVCEQYGAKYHHDFTSMKLDRIARRAAFLVDKEGKIRYAEVLESAGDLPDFDAIQQAYNGA